MPLRTKSEIRSYYNKLRAELSPDAKALMDDRIAESFLKTDEYSDCELLLAFVSKDTEVNTDRIINQGFKDGKNVAVPKCNPDSKTMSFFVINSYGDLELGYFGIYEPKTHCDQLITFGSSVCVVPGLAYDKRCFRVGFGGGYYDRFLKDYNGVSVGVCYSACVEKRLPVSSFDRPVDILITDNNIIRKDNGYGN